MDKVNVLFLCTANSCRSQMAEGFARALYGGQLEAFSAGSSPAGFIDPFAIRVMAERGLDISTQSSKHISSLAGREFDLLVTVCDSAREACPVFPGASLSIHKSFPDPQSALGEECSEEQRLAAYRSLRDEIAAYIAQIGETLGLQPSAG